MYQLRQSLRDVGYGIPMEWQYAPYIPEDERLPEDFGWEYWYDKALKVWTPALAIMYIEENNLWDDVEYWAEAEEDLEWHEYIATEGIVALAWSGRINDLLRSIILDNDAEEFYKWAK